MAAPTATEQDLWKLYAGRLKDQVLQGQALGSANRFYIPPLNTAGIMAGPNTSQPITNYGLAVSGDALISSDNPLFVPSGDTFSKKALDYLQNVQLLNNVDDGLKQVRDQRKADFDKANDDYWTTYDKAKARWTSSTGGTGDFDSWASQSYPQLDVAAQNVKACQGALNQIQTQIQGPGWQGLQSKIDALTGATNYRTPTTFNMEVDSSLVGAAASTGATPKPKEYRPHYNFGANATYPKDLNQWVQKASQPGAATTDIEFSLSEASKYSWSDLGFSSTSFSGSVGYGPFFSVNYTQNDTQQFEKVDISSNSSSIHVKISATGIKAYDVGPDSTWDPGNIKNDYPNLFANSNPKLYGPMVQARKIIVGYNVTVSITMDQSTYSSVKQLTQKASSQSGGASANIFGYNINLGGGGSRSSNESTDLSKVNMSDSNFTITFPGANNTVPLLMGVVGTVIGS